MEAVTATISNQELFFGVMRGMITSLIKSESLSFFAPYHICNLVSKISLKVLAKNSICTSILQGHLWNLYMITIYWMTGIVARLSYSAPPLNRTVSSIFLRFGTFFADQVNTSKSILQHSLLTVDIIDILISYSQLSFDDICKDSIQTRDESSRSLIANVTDLDNHQFSVALKTTDSFFVSLLESIMGLG